MTHMRKLGAGGIKEAARCSCRVRASGQSCRGYRYPISFRKSLIIIIVLLSLAASVVVRVCRVVLGRVADLPGAYVSEIQRIPATPGESDGQLVSYLAIVTSWFLVPEDRYQRASWQRSVSGKSYSLPAPRCRSVNREPPLLGSLWHVWHPRGPC